MVAGNLARKMNTTPEPEVHISESPVKWCSVSLSDMVSRGKRLEAGSFDIEAKAAEKAIIDCKYGCVKLIGGIAERAFHAPRFKRSYVTKTHPDSVGFLGSSEMLDIKPVPVKFITKEQAQALNLFAKPGDVLLSCSGTIGNIGFVSRTLSSFALSQHIIKIECSSYSGYLYACLKHPYIQAQLQALIYGAVIPEIEPEHLNNVLIPDAPARLKQRISSLVEQSYILRDESNELIDRATDLMVAELHLPAIHDFQKLSVPVSTFDVKLSNINLRLDASYHVPAVDVIVAHLKESAAEVTTVGDSRISRSVILPGRFKRVYVEEGYGRIFIGGKQLGELDPSNKKYLSNVHHGNRIAQQLELKENMTLITCSGTIGRVALVGKHWDGWTANQHIIRVVPANKDIAGYLYIFLASDYGRTLITRYTYGSVVDEIDDDHVRQIPIPLLRNQDVQQQINSLALGSNAKRYEAYKLEQEALRIMNEEVIFAK